jgi:hypothetical protein
MIPAFHKVGGEEMSDEELADLFDYVVEQGYRGELLPATERLSRFEMDRECFGDEVGLRARFPGAERHFIRAIEELAAERIASLPEEGSTQTLFNCFDVLAGDINLVFLSIGNWYSIPNGFVFDAERLIDGGAKLRKRDLLGRYGEMFEAVSAEHFRSVVAAKRAILSGLEVILEAHQLEGREAKTWIREIYEEKENRRQDTELAWEGRLPLSLAVEAVRVGEPVTYLLDGR